MPTSEPTRSLDLSWMAGKTMVFSPATVEMLNHYVYMLTHPGGGRIFYVGEGQGQRVFQHIRDARDLLLADDLVALSEDETDQEHSERLGTIAAILRNSQMPGMFIVRDGMSSQEEAQLVEGALIDVLDYLGDLGLAPPLTNVQSGHGVASFRTVSDVEATHGESFELGSLPDLQTGERVLFLNLNRRWGEVGAGLKSLLQVTQGAWKLNLSKARECRYVVAHAYGIVRGVFRPESWSEPDSERRISFHAVTPDGLQGEGLCNRNIAGVFGDGKGRGSQNPVRYVTF